MSSPRTIIIGNDGQISKHEAVNEKRSFYAFGLMAVLSLKKKTQNKTKQKKRK